jgi:hypothetical protein
MLSAIRRALWLLAPLVVPIRYSVRVHGRERARGLSGRLERFPKAVGEMISLLALEEPFTRLRTRCVSRLLGGIPAVGHTSVAPTVRKSGGRVAQGPARCSSRMRRNSPRAAGPCSER